MCRRSLQPGWGCLGRLFSAGVGEGMGTLPFSSAEPRAGLLIYNQGRDPGEVIASPCPRSDTVGFPENPSFPHPSPTLVVAVSSVMVRLFTAFTAVADTEHPPCVILVVFVITTITLIVSSLAQPCQRLAQGLTHSVILVITITVSVSSL